MLERLLHPFAKRWAWVATALAVQKRFGEVRGGYLASAVTLTVFLSLFPLLLVAIAVIGQITTNSADLPERVVANLGLTGQAANTMIDALEHAADTKRAASIIGFIGLIWSGLGMAAALAYALDSTWQQTGRDIKDKLRGLAWGGGALLILGGSIAITTLIKLYFDGLILDALSIAITLLLNFAFWMWTFLALSYQRVHWKAYAPGAILGAIGLELIKQVASLLPQLFEGASALYGSIGVVFGLIAILALFGRVAVYASVLNVVRWEEDHGTVTVNVEVPRIRGKAPTDANRTGAAET